MQIQEHFDDGRGRYPDKLTLQVPRGFREMAKRAAQAERSSMGELIRRAVIQHVESVLNDDNGRSHSEARA